jgi:hypothetical protein
MRNPACCSCSLSARESQTSTLTQLKLSGNFIASLGSEEIGNALAHNQWLTELDL